MKKHTSGITLIALVVTIIVLLILAGISITMLSGENGILQAAKNASIKTKEASAKEEVSLAWIECETEYKLGELSREEAFSKENMNRHLNNIGEIIDLAYNEAGKSAVQYRSNIQNAEYFFEIGNLGEISIGNEFSVYNSKMEELYNKGWSVGATSSGYIAADYSEMKLYTLDSSFNTTNTETLTPSDVSLFTVNNEKITATTATGVVIIPDNINATSIAASAFKSKTGITRIILPPSITTIADGTSTSTGAFCGCTGLVDFAFSKNLTKIGNYAFYGCTKIANIDLPNTITTLGTYAFYNCKLINKIVIPRSISSLNNYVFYGCTKISEIKIPSNITSIGTCALGGCSGLASIVIEEGNTVYDSRENCNAIIRKSDNKLLQGCKTTTIPSGVSIIEANAFIGCTGLTDVNTLLNNITNIGNYAFANCTGITTINIPAQLTTIGINPFYGCTAITSITVESGNTVYDSRDNCNAIVNKSNNTIVSACKNTTISSTIQSIGQHSFRGQTGITSITIPNTITSIGNYAFYGCSKISSITIPTSIDTIWASTFYGCSSLTRIDIPANITKIDTSAFQNCSSVLNVYIHGTSLSTVNKSAFVSLKQGSKIYVGNTTIKALFTSDRYTSSRTSVEVDATLLSN